jgi:hypothetical protein
VIKGEVTPERQGVVRLQICRPGGSSEEIRVAVDTGFTGSLALPTDTITRLGLHLVGARRGRLADGSLVLMPPILLTCCGTVCCAESRFWKQADRVWLVSPFTMAMFSRLKP